MLAEYSLFSREVRGKGNSPQGTRKGVPHQHHTTSKQKDPFYTLPEGCKLTSVAFLSSFFQATLAGTWPRVTSCPVVMSKPMAEAFSLETAENLSVKVV